MSVSTRGVGPVFPAPVYREAVLAQVFEDAKRYFLEPLLEIECAHTLMLARQGIMPRREAASCLRAVAAFDRDAAASAKYDGSFEDLFFYLEHHFAAVCGAEVAGKMHTARSRNDIDLTMYRMVLRGLLLRSVDSLLQLRGVLVELAWEHRADLMPAYTHNQPAQPTTLGHYLMAMVEVLERDVERARAAYSRVNRSPLGACAITTTGFPIDRHMTERLLGFEGLQVNSYGAIAAVDYLTESCSTVAIAMVSLGRFVQDLLLWSTAEFGYLRLSNAFVQVSSIMPQKRNPVALEHVRILASRALTEAQSVAGCVHNTPFADMNDSEDDLQPLAYTAFEDADRAVRLLTGCLEQAEFNTERMAAAADSNFLSVTELADTLVRGTGMSFHAAHGIVSRAVRELSGSGGGYDVKQIADVIERELSVAGDAWMPVPRAEVEQALSAKHFVEVRSIEGGPAAPALEPEIGRAREQIVSDRRWWERNSEHLREARAQMHREYQDLCESEHAG